MSEKLKPCHGCDSIAELLRDNTVFRGQSYSDRYPRVVANQTHGFQIRCAKCGLQTCWWHYKREAIKAWNFRSITTKGKREKYISLLVDVDALAKAIKKIQNDLVLISKTKEK